MPKLMIVDDEADVREFAANFFRRRKIDTVVAASGEEAIEAVAKEKPDLILLDIKMGGIDGIETLKRLKEKDPSIKAVMVTGRKPEEQESCEQCKNLGVLDYVHKPLELDELEKIVFKHLPAKK